MDTKTEDALENLMSTSYIVGDDGVPRKASNTEEWLENFKDRDKKIVKQEWIGYDWLSTVFLSLDHSFGQGPPVLWESMTFSVVSDEERQERCSGDREQAVFMHEALKAELLAKMSPEARSIHHNLLESINSSIGIYGLPARARSGLTAGIQRSVPDTAVATVEIHDIITKLNEQTTTGA